MIFKFLINHSFLTSSSISEDFFEDGDPIDDELEELDEEDDGDFLRLLSFLSCDEDLLLLWCSFL